MYKEFASTFPRVFHVCAALVIENMLLLKTHVSRWWICIIVLMGVSWITISYTYFPAAFFFSVTAELYIGNQNVFCWVKYIISDIFNVRISSTRHSLLLFSLLIFIKYRSECFSLFRFNIALLGLKSPSRETRSEEPRAPLFLIDSLLRLYWERPIDFGGIN